MFQRIHEKEEAGATMVEYALMASLIAIVCLAGVARIGINAENTFVKVRETLKEAGGDNEDPLPPPPPP